MAVELDGGKGITDFSQWYLDYKVDERDGCLDPKAFAPCAGDLFSRYELFKREMDARCEGFEHLEMLADNEVISPKPDLPNVSSGETAGLVRRIARTLAEAVMGGRIVLAGEYASSGRPSTTTS